MSPFQVPRKLPPLPRCYWVVEDSLLAGAYPGKVEKDAHRQRIEGLYKAGMRTFISLMESHERNNDGLEFVPYIETLEEVAGLAGEPVECRNFPIKDRSITTVENMRNILDAIDESLAKNKPVYVHCFGGIGRTGTVISCWLLRHRHATRQDVLKLLKELRVADRQRAGRDAPENDEQRGFVLSWPEGKHKDTRLPPATRSDWFTELVGFSESSPDQVRSHLRVQDNRLIAEGVGKSYVCGRLGVPSLNDLREQVGRINTQKGRLSVQEVVADVQELHKDSANAGAVFQVASQFNLLEMVSPSRTPEEGVGIYQYDRTQGPACAVACGAGTIYRNYFVDLGTQIGQTQDRQIDCLADIGDALGNSQNDLWKMRNGYALPTAQGLKIINQKLEQLSSQEREDLQGRLRVGVHWDTQVTLAQAEHCVTQVYCSALPVAYCSLASDLWEPFARFVLEGAYEATFLAAIINSMRTGNRTLYLTSLGGGAFGNESEWIYDGIEKSLRLFKDYDLQVRMVSYGRSNPQTKKFIDLVLRDF